MTRPSSRAGLCALILSAQLLCANQAAAEGQVYWWAGNGLDWPYGYGATPDEACVNQKDNTPGWYGEVPITQCVPWPGNEEVGYCSRDDGWNNGLVCLPGYCPDGEVWVGPTTECCPGGTTMNPGTGECEGVEEDKNEPDPCNETSAPVNFTTGNKRIREVDLAASTNTRNLEFARTWNSYNREWRFSYRDYLVQETHRASIYRADGAVQRFEWDFDVQRWVADPDVKGELKGVYGTSNSYYTYISESGVHEFFDRVTGKYEGYYEPDHTRVWVIYPDANTVEVIFANSDEQGIVLVLDDDDRVVQMTDPDGEVYRYRYREDGALEFVSFPDATPGAAGGNPFGEDNPYREYLYDDPVDDLLITGIRDGNGDRYKFVQYDDEGRAIASGYSDGSIGTTYLDYSNLGDPADPRVVVTNPLGRDTVYHLTELYGVSRVGDIEGAAGANCLADLQRREYYPDTGWLEREYDRSGVATHYEYYTGHSTGPTYSKYGQVKTITRAESTPDERVFRFKWTWAGKRSRLLSRVELEGQWRRDYEYELTSGRLTRVITTDLTQHTEPYSTNGRTRITKFSYTDYPDERVRVRMEKLRLVAPPVVPERYDYWYEYDRLTRVVDPLGQVTELLDHNGRGQPRRIVDANGSVTELYYTPRGRVERVVRDAGGIGATTEWEYDGANQLVGITLADGTRWDLDYDGAHRLIAVTNGLGEQVHLLHDAAGNPDLVAVEDAGDVITRVIDLDFDGLGRVHRQGGFHGQATGYNYDAQGHLERIDDGVNPATRLEYDHLDRLRRVTDARGNDIDVGYDPGGHVQSVTDQRGLHTGHVYDGFGNLLQVDSPDSGLVVFHYDEHGNRLSEVDARGVETRYTYDPLGRLSAVEFPSEPEKDITYIYDSVESPGQGCDNCAGRLAAVDDHSGRTHYSYDALGRLTARTHIVAVPGGSEPSLTTAFGYNAAGRLEEITYPGGQLVKFHFDAAGQVAQVTRDYGDPENSGGTISATLLSDIRHQPFGPVAAATYASGLQLDRNFDLEGRLDTQRVVGEVPVQHLAYSYDATGNIAAVDDLVDPSRSETYAYDSLHRLESAAGRYGDIAYTYDAGGNRVSRTITRGNLVITEVYTTAPDSNRVVDVAIDDGAVPATREFEYDQRGNLVEEKRADGSFMRPQYDATNRMHRVDP